MTAPQSTAAMSLEEKREMARRLLRRGTPASAPAAPPPAPDTDRLTTLPALLDLEARQAELARLGIADPYFHGHETVSADTVVVDRRSLINFAGYNYLGLSGHREVSAAARAAIDRHGTSASASRIATGEIPLHRRLERAVADLYGTEDAIAFVGGYVTNVTVLGHLFGPRDLIVHDSLIHNSALAGAQLSGAHRLAFPHNDLDALDRLLAAHRNRHERVVIVVEGVYSMDGDRADLAALVALKRRHRALLMVDEAHALGVIGARGYGSGELAGIAGGDVDLWMGTFSKSLAACGGFIAAEARLVNYLKYTAPGFVYSVGLSPPDTAAALAALEILQREPERVARLQARSRLFLDRARAAGLDTGASDGTAVVPVIIGQSMKALKVAARLHDAGINVQPILYPAVEEATARLRFFISSLHSEAQITDTVDRIAEALAAEGGRP